MTSSAGKFKRIPLWEAFGSQDMHVFGGFNLFESLINKKEWFVLTLTDPYFLYKRPENDPKSMDIFSEFTDEELNRLCLNPNTFFMFNYMWEGSSYKDYNYFELLTVSALRKGIPLEKIFFVSSNLKDELVYNLWQKQYYPQDRINVISFNYFAEYMGRHLYEGVTIDQTVANIKEDQKFFLSLNRRVRPYRAYTVYKLFASQIKKNTMMSYDRVSFDDVRQFADIRKSIDPKVFQELIDSAPSVLDFHDFNINWACEPCEAARPVGLFEKSLISLVSETLFDTAKGSSLFYSEKTFKPILYNHPIMIFGQPGLNTTLSDVGFKCYNKHFDLSFDLIEDHVTRVDSQVKQLETLHDNLEAMSVNRKIEWVLQDRETMEYNKEALRAQDFNRKKLQVFIDIVKSVSE
jgi:hypothetical protein